MDEKLSNFVLKALGKEQVLVKLTLKDIHRYMSFEKNPELIAMWAQIYIDFYKKLQVE